MPRHISPLDKPLLRDPERQGGERKQRPAFGQKQVHEENERHEDRDRPDRRRGPRKRQTGGRKDEGEKETDQGDSRRRRGENEGAHRDDGKDLHPGIETMDDRRSRQILTQGDHGSSPLFMADPRGDVETDGPQKLPMAEHLGRCSLDQDHPLVHDHDPVRADDVPHVVGDVDHRHPLPVQSPDDVKHPLFPRRIEIGRRFVEGDVPGIHREDPCDRQEPLFAAGKGMGRSFLQTRHPDHLEAVIHASPDLRGRQGEVARTKGHILLDRHPDDLALRILEDHPHPPPDLPDGGGVDRSSSHPRKRILPWEQEGV